MIKNRLLTSVAVIAVFLIAYYGRRIVDHLFDIQIQSYYLRVFYAYCFWVIPTAVFVFITEKRHGFSRILGLDRGIGKALLFAGFAVSPMFISSAIAGSVNPDVYNFSEGGVHAFQLVSKTIFAGFFEEYLFRGFLFGLLFLRYGWGFIPASVLGACVFGLGHVYQGNTLSETAGVFAVTAMGAVWFAWLYIEWDRNLWVPVFLHVFMNTSWSMFEVSDNALGGVGVNVFRIITIAITVVLTIRKGKIEGWKIGKSNLFFSTPING